MKFNEAVQTLYDRMQTTYKTIMFTIGRAFTFHALLPAWLLFEILTLKYFESEE